MYSVDGVRLERTGWRCEKISARHREWGYDCPAVDLDFMVAEYNHGKPVALIEYKDRRARQPDLRHATYRALASLANGYIDLSPDGPVPKPLPFLIAIYDSTDWWFRVIPVNERAREHYRHVLDKVITEQRFVRSLYLLRKRVLDENDEVAIARLNTTLPSEAA